MQTTTYSNIQNQRIYSEWLGICLALIIPLSFTLTWLCKNTQLPTSDAANYLSTAVEIYHSFINHHFWNGIASCFTIRGWRPIFFPVLAVPFLLMSHGNLYFSCCAVAILSLFLCVCYSYLLFRIKLDRFSAILATSIIALLPLIQIQLVGFYPESVLFPCIMGAIYHLIKSNQMTDYFHSIGFVITVALALIIRPVEAVTYLLFIMGFYYSNSSRRREGWQLLIISFSALFLFAIGIALQSVNPEIGMLKILHILFAVASVGILLSVMGLKKTQLEKNITIKTYALKVYIAIYLSVLIWFLPYAFATFSWIYQTSFGDVAAGTVRAAGPVFSIWNELVLHVSAEGSAVVISCFFLMLVSLMVLTKPQRTAVLSSPVFIFLLLIAPLPIIEVFFTVQDIIRKMAIAFPALIMAMLLISLSNGRYHRIRQYAVMILFFMQITLISLVCFGPSQFDKTLSQLQGYALARPVVTRPNPHNVLRDFLANQAKQLHLKTIGLAVNPYTLEPVDPFLMTTVVNALNKQFDVSYVYVPDDAKDNIEKTKQQFNAIFISDNFARMQINSSTATKYLQQSKQEKNPSLKLLYQFLYFYANNQLEKQGWKVESCLVIKSGCLLEPVTAGIRRADCLGCLLLPKKI